MSSSRAKCPVDSERGQGIVEFAVIFPIFIFLVFAVIDGAIVFGRYSEVSHAAKEGVRLAATGEDSDDVAQGVKDHAPGGLLDDAATACSGDEFICVQYIDGPDGEPAGEVGSGVMVRVRYHYSLITPLASQVAGGFSVESCAVARIERPPVDAVVRSGSAGC